MANIILSIIMAILSIFGIVAGSGSSGSTGGTTGGVTDSDNQIYDSPTSYDIQTNLSYGSSGDQTFDLIIPQGVGKKLNLYVYIHGGGWGSGDKSAGANVIQKYAKEENMIGATLNYRLVVPGKYKITCNTILTDIHSAMNRIYNVCASKGYTINKAIVAGDSAGGHLALLYSYKYKSSCPINIRMVYSNCGPTDLTDINFYKLNPSLAPTMLELQGTLIGQSLSAEDYFTLSVQQELLKISPIAYVNSGSPATIFNSCGRDDLVPVSNGEKLDQVLSSAGVDHYYANFPNSGHCSRNAADAAITSQFDAKFEQMFDKYIR